MLARVRKSIQSDTGLLQAGDIVDVSAWRNTKTLLASRYIELVEDAPAPASKPKAEKKVEENAEVESAKEVKAEKSKSKK